jgi:hypothetical protein
VDLTPISVALPRLWKFLASSHASTLHIWHKFDTIVTPRIVSTESATNTEHPAIRTESLNINFIFSDVDAKLSQWYYLYSRLPYVLFYARLLVEHVCSRFAKTEPKYLEDVERRVAAGTILWSRNVEQSYRHPVIEDFVRATRERLDQHCHAAGRRSPTLADLAEMLDSGILPPA